MTQIVHRTDVAVAVRVESGSLVIHQSGGTALVDGAVAAACACGRIGLFAVGGALCVLAAIAAVLAPVLRAAGTAAMRAAEGCDCE